MGEDHDLHAAVAQRESLRRIAPTWVLTVDSLTNTRAAISVLDSPRATAPNTSRSFSVRATYAAGAGAASRNWVSRSADRSAGASTALPAWTVRIASRSSAGVVSLSRKPLAPWRIAVAARSSRLKVVSTTTRTGRSRRETRSGRKT